MFNGPSINWWVWGAPSATPPSGQLKLGTRYRRGYKSNYIPSLIGFITWLITLR